MSKHDEVKKLKERIEELEFVKDFQQDILGYGLNSIGYEGY
jgi:hypothetical protein